MSDYGPHVGLALTGNYYNPGTAATVLIGVKVGINIHVRELTEDLWRSWRKTNITSE